MRRTVVTLIGMAWLSRLSADSGYLTGVALPMVLIGIGQGGVLGPFTAAGITGVAAAGSATLDAHHLLAHRVSTALTAGTGMLAVALVLVVALMARPGKAAAGSAITVAKQVFNG